MAHPDYRDRPHATAESGESTFGASVRRGFEAPPPGPVGPVAPPDTGCGERAPASAGAHRARLDPANVRRALKTALLVLVAAAVVAVTCAMLASGSREYVSDIGDLPINGQDEARGAGEVWFTIAMSALAVATTIAWWRRSIWRGPVGLGLSAAAAAAQTGVGALVWLLVVRLRRFDGGAETGVAHLRAPVLTGTTSLWLAAVCAVLTYIALAILNPRSDLTPDDLTPERRP